MRSGPGRNPLPYEILAGVEPTANGWLVAPGNLQGITLAPQPLIELPTLADVLDYRPSFAIVALHAPVGTLEEPGGLRPCDAAAQDRMGARRRSIVPAPARTVLAAASLEEAQALDPTIDAVRWRSLPRMAEAVREVQSWRQRSVWEVNPELAFLQMREGEPLRFSRRSLHGRDERLALLVDRLPGADWVLDARPSGVRESKAIDALADLWTARRVRARAMTRLSDPPVWDEEGVRMDIVC